MSTHGKFVDQGHLIKH